MTTRTAWQIAAVATAALAVAAAPARSANPACHLLGDTVVDLSDGAEIAGDAIASQPGGLVRTGRAVMALDGTVLVGDAVVLGRDTTVDDVETNDLEEGSQSEVRGEVRSATLPVLEPACTIPAVECGGDAVTVRRRKTTDLPPGRYGAVVVGNGATLRLTDGLYEFCDLRVGRKGKVVGGGTIAVADEVTVQPGGSIRGAGEDDLPLVAVAGRKIFVSRKGTVQAVLAAPDGDVVLGPAVRLEGRACGATVRLGKGARLSCVSVPLPSTTSTTLASTTSTTLVSTTSSTSTTLATTTSTSTTTSSTTASTSSSTTSTSTTFASTTTSTTIVGTSTSSTSSTSTSSTVPTSTSSTSSTSTSIPPPTSTSTSVPSTTSTSVTTSTTTSTIIGALCGNGATDAGESCDDGNNSDNDACPANCTVAACTPLAGTQRVATVSFAPPPGTTVAGMTVLVNYPEGQVSIPGTGAISATSFVPLYPPSEVFIRGFDLDHAVRGVMADSAPVPAGAIFQLRFQDCDGAQPPLPGALTCVVLDASDEFTNPVAGVTCDVAIP
jgi:cysteine-rich repeat protein